MPYDIRYVLKNNDFTTCSTDTNRASEVNCPVEISGVFHRIDLKVRV